MKFYENQKIKLREQKWISVIFNAVSRKNKRM